MKVRTLLIAFFLFAIVSPGYALTTINFMDGGNAFVDLSLKNLNLIKFPSSGMRAYTSSKALDIKLDEGNVFVKFLSEGPLPPQEVFFVTPSGEVFSMILIPREIPAQTVYVRLPKENISDALEWETAHSYISGLKELIKAMYGGIPPRGFSVKEMNEGKKLWAEVRVILKQVYRGATLQGEVYEVTNVAKEPVRFGEKEFYEQGVLAVSIERHEIGPGEKTELYLVRKTKAQREFERVLHRQNPLDILKEGREGGR